MVIDRRRRRVLSPRIIIKDSYGVRIRIGDKVIPVIKNEGTQPPGLLKQFDPGSRTPYLVDYGAHDWVRAVRVIKCS